MRAATKAPAPRTTEPTAIREAPAVTVGIGREVVPLVAVVGTAVALEDDWAAEVLAAEDWAAEVWAAEVWAVEDLAAEDWAAELWAGVL